MDTTNTADRLPRGIDLQPHGLLRSGHVQSMLSSISVRRIVQRPMRRRVAENAERVVLDVMNGVRLAGIFTPQRARPQARGLALLFHGWEGSTDSSYVVQIGARLLADGWDIFRLNFRDHGGTYALNPEIFNSCMLDEVVAASIEVERRWHHAGTPMVLAGFSLGGNFALRVALAAPDAGLKLDKAVAVCPVIDPRANLKSLERAPWVYHWYFMHQWRASLKRKQKLFPERMLFTRHELGLGLRELTRTLVERHTGFGTLENYLDGYSVAGKRMANMRVATTILTSSNDPIIPVSDFRELVLPPCVELDIADNGGHCGFLCDWHFRSFTDDYIAARFNALAP
ncbi:MAG TPA: alpha/beta fold hydrolase [Rhodanobacteraceae bacterium]